MLHSLLFNLDIWRTQMINTMIATISNTSRIIAYIILALYLTMMVVIAYYCRTKKDKGLNDFFLAGRKMNGWMSAFSYGATYFSAVIFIGYAGKLGWSFGLATVWIGLGNAIIGSWLAWKVLAGRTRLMTHNIDAKTMPEFFEKRYGDKNIKLLASVIIFVFLIPYSASVYQGLGYLFQLIFGINYVWIVLLMAAITAIYVFFGGYLATALTDFVQGLIMIIGVVIMVVLLMNYVDWGEGIMRAKELSGGLIPSTQTSTSFIDSPMFTVATLFILTSVGIWGLPQSVHKFYAVKDKSAIKKAMIVSTAFAIIIGMGAYFVGAFGQVVLEGVLPEGGFDHVIPNLLIITMPSLILGLIGVLVLSASISSLASLTLSSSSAVAVDMYKGYINKGAKEQRVKLLLRVLCLVFLLLSALFAINEISLILTLMSLSWGTLAGCFLGPYLWGLYSKKITRAAAWTSMITSLVVTIGMTLAFGIYSPAVGESGVMAIIKGGLTRSPMIGVTVMLLSLIVTPLVSLFTKRPDDKIIEKAFQKSEEVLAIESK